MSHGLTAGTFRSWKCRTLRVASVARRASAIPAICVSRISTGSPDFCRSAASEAASVAAELSKSKTRFSRSSWSSWANDTSSVCRRRPLGKRERPKRASKSVMLVIHIDSAGWRSSHATTRTSGACRINADSTLVSRMINCGSPLIAQAVHATPAVRWSARFS